MRGNNIPRTPSRTAPRGAVLTAKGYALNKSFGVPLGILAVFFRHMSRNGAVLPGTAVKAFVAGYPLPFVEYLNHALGKP